MRRQPDTRQVSMALTSYSFSLSAQSTRWFNSLRRWPTRSLASRLRSVRRASSAARCGFDTNLSLTSLFPLIIVAFYATQAMVMNVEGVWKDLTDNVNLMASNLTTQVRSIAVV